MGRPVEQVPQTLVEEIVEWIAEGNTLREYCRKEGKPSYVTVYNWLKKDATFAERFACARDSGEDVISQECLSIADDRSNDVSGELEMPNGVAVQRDRLRVDTRLKLLAKWNPKKWGDKVQQEVTGPEGGPIQAAITVTFVRPNAHSGNS